ncbi:sterol desaturase family protein [Pontixanthobacter gangjinensis]|uniref:Fatty acid hydroxylase n=1 Tax=Pontixanthobacter gangjinensis TaxID=1028742 RepID=A0A6I4SIK7_9SPHN|nr:sterol desaturase family protein [Pontixanthobacter gangjinensis]MXO55435.1 fatty acid hydroxylase [Pontixanthobacter gangjinensis]
MKFGKLAMLIGAGAVVGGILLAERKVPLREQKKPAIPRNIRNLAMGAGCAVIVAAVEEPLTKAIAEKNLAGKRGFAQHLPRPLRLLGGIAAMDYGFYWWHVATHKLPFLWRFHRVHHIDPDMDASTAVRFHPVDMLVSLPWRLVQVRLSGVSPKSLRYWRNFFNFSILFHHSNIKLPDGVDEKLSAVLTTPKMHGIHHSNVVAESDSNFTSGLSFWDRLHGTFLSQPPQDGITIGVDDPEAAEDVAIDRALGAPFRQISAPRLPEG